MINLSSKAKAMLEMCFLAGSYRLIQLLAEFVDKQKTLF